MRLFFSLFLGLLVSISACGQEQQFVEQEKELLLMGSRFNISVVAESKQLAWDAINVGIEEITRIEKLISSWDENSQTSEINRQAGIQAVKVDKELYDLIFRAKKVARLTQGAFDISYASMDRIWKFDGSMEEMPSPEIVTKASAKINWKNIITDKENQTIFLKEKGMKIGFGALGKGYAANRAKAIMQNMTGIKGGVVNASGDLIAWGKSLNTESRTIKIADPKDKNKILGHLQLNNQAIVTSGDYEKFVVFQGKRYAHIIDPRTGYPTTGTKSVTILSSDAELCDALATSVFVMGKEKGLELINRLNGIEGLIVTDENELLVSQNLKLNYY